jgi:hypothetical protein
MLLLIAPGYHDLARVVTSPIVSHTRSIAGLSIEAIPHLSMSLGAARNGASAHLNPMASIAVTSL